MFGEFGSELDFFQTYFAKNRVIIIKQKVTDAAVNKVRVIIMVIGETEG